MRAGTHTRSRNRRWAWTAIPDAPFAVSGESSVLGVGDDAFLVIAEAEDTNTYAAKCARRTGWQPFPSPPTRIHAGAAVASRESRAFVWSGMHVHNPEEFRKQPFARAGAIYEPPDGWRRTPAAPILPRAYAFSHWTLHGIVVWGGWRYGGNGDSVALRDGAVFDPVEHRWRKIAGPPDTGAVALEPIVYSGTLICIAHDREPLVRMTFGNASRVATAAESVRRRIRTESLYAYEYDVAVDEWRELLIGEDLADAFVAPLSGGDIVGLRANATLFRWRPDSGSVHEEAPLPSRQVPIDVAAVVSFRAGFVCLVSESPERLSAWYWDAESGWDEIPSPPEHVSDRDRLQITATTDAVLLWGGRVGDPTAPAFCRDGALLSELSLT
jgi:hypothetical protein